MKRRRERDKKAIEKGMYKWKVVVRFQPRTDNFPSMFQNGSVTPTSSNSVDTGVQRSLREAAHLPHLVLRLIMNRAAFTPLHMSPCRVQDTLKGTGKFVPLQAQINPKGSKSLRLPEFTNSRHMNEVSLSAQCTGRLYPPGDICRSYFC
jgi:hypothetical protein